MSESGPGLQDKRGPNRAHRGLLRFVVPSVVLGLTFAFVFLAHTGFSHRGTLSVQSKAMLARSESLQEAVRPGIWPPGYPLVLLLGRSAGLPPGTMNLLLFFASILLLGLLFKRMFPETRPPWAVILFAACAFNYYSLSQFTSEILVVPLSLCAAYLLLLYLRKRTVPLLLGLSLCCAVIFVSRYHALAWLLPLLVGLLLFPLRKVNRRSVGHLAVFGLIALMPIGLVMRGNYNTNRHLTGMARLGYNVRQLPENLEYYRESTGPQDNIRLIFKTLFIDFLSPRALATHEVNRSAYRPSWLEWGIVLILTLAIGIAAFYYFRGRGRLKNASIQDKQALKNEVSEASLAAEFFIGYLVITVLLWAVGNNDPIYTRFLYPSYPFLILWGFSWYSSVKKTSSSLVARLPFMLLYLSLVSVNVFKIGSYLE